MEEEDDSLFPFVTSSLKSPDNERAFISAEDRFSKAEEYLSGEYDIQDRLKGAHLIQSVLASLKDSSKLEGASVRLLRVIGSAINDNAFKVQQAGLYLCEQLAHYLGPQVQKLVPEITLLLVPKLGGKYVVRQALMKIYLCLMESLQPDLVLQPLLSAGLKHKLSKIREDTVNVVIVALLKYQRSKVNLLWIAQEVAPLLVDGKQRVRQAGLEVFALLANKLGKGNIQPLVSAVASVEKSQGREGGRGNVMAAFQARLSRKQLPYINEDGLVEHALPVVARVTSASKPHPQHSLSGADVEWILQGSASTNRSCSPVSHDQGGGASKGPNSIRPYQSAGTRNKLPWETEITNGVKKKSPSETGLSPKKALPPTVVRNSQEIRRQSLTNKKQTPNSYAELYRARMRRLNVSGSLHLQQPSFEPSVIPISDDWQPRDQLNQQPMYSVGEGYTSSLLQKLESGLSMPYRDWNSVPPYQNTAEDTSQIFSMTWPSPIIAKEPGSTVKTNLVAKQQPKQRPSSKPRVQHPLKGLQEQLASEDSPENGEGKMAGKGYQDDFEDIYDDQFEGNSLTSSMTSFTSRDMADVVKRIDENEAVSTTRCSVGVSHDHDPPPSQPTSKSSQATTGREAFKVRPARLKSTLKQTSPTNSSSSAMTKNIQDQPPANPSGTSPLRQEEEVELSQSARSRTQSQKASSTPSSNSSSPVVLPKVKMSKSAKERLLNQKLRHLEKGQETKTSTHHERQLHKPPVPPIAVSPPKLNGPMPDNEEPVTMTTATTTPSCVTNESRLEVLHPLQNADQGVRSALDLLAASHWEEKIEGLLTVRRLAMHHEEVLIPQIGPVIQAAEAEVKNLRSAVSRAAIACFGDLFACLGRNMEGHIDSIVKTLLHKTGESNHFIRDDCEKALHEMVQGISPQRSLIVLVNGGADNRNATVRKSTSLFIEEAITQMGGARLLSSSKDVLEKVLPALVSFVRDKSPEARYYARKSIHQFCYCSDFERVCTKILSGPQRIRLIEAADMIKTKGVGEFPTEPGSAKRRHHSSIETSKTVSSPPVKGRNTSSGPRQSVQGKSKSGSLKHQRTQSDTIIISNDLATTLDHLTSGDWCERLQGISALEKLIQKYPTSINSSITKVFDAFTPCLADANSKVNLQALQVFSDIAPLLGNQLGPALRNVLPALPITSKVPGIASAAQLDLDLICQCVDPGTLLQPLADLTQSANPRTQPLYIERISRLLPLVGQSSSSRIHLHILPLTWNLLGSKVASTLTGKAALTELCKALYSCLGDLLFEKASTLPPGVVMRLQEFVKK